MCKRKRNSPESHLNFVRGLLRLRANERALSNSGGFRLLFAKPKTYPRSSPQASTHSSGPGSRHRQRIRFKT